VLRGPFGLLWVGQTVSLLGDGMLWVILTWQLAVVWHRAALLGALLTVRIVGELAALALGGWIVDRLRRRTVVLAADVGRALVLAALAVTLTRNHRPLPLMLELAAFGLLTGIFRPALVAWVPELVTRTALPAANSALTISTQASLVGGPAVGALLMGLGQTRLALLLDGVSFAVAALCSLPLPSRASVASRASPLAQAAEGFRIVRRMTWIGGTILLASILNIGTITAQRVALPSAAATRFGHLGGYGTILVAMGVGAVVTALAFARVAEPRRLGQTAYAGMLTFSLATLGFGVARGPVAAVLLGLAWGIGMELTDLRWTTGLQRNVPDRLLGRVSALDQFGSFLFLPLAFAAGGLIVQTFRPEVFLIGAGVLGSALALVGLALPALHEWRPVEEGARAQPGVAGQRAEPLRGRAAEQEAS
jgi:Major Facilitator Superfamily